jgi:transmembrane sensor
MEDSKKLFERYKGGECSQEELQIINRWLFEISAGDVSDLDDDDFDHIQHKVWIALQHETAVTARLPVATKARVYPLWRLIAIAGCLLLVGGLAIFFYVNFDRPLSKQDHLSADIPAGKNAATLILSNGEEVSLSKTPKGRFKDERKVSIIKTSDGQISYKVNGNDKGEIYYNTLKTALGEQYQLILPDLTKVWLNAGSSLRFPTSFSNAVKREVILTGEAYFEVTKDKMRPFLVKTSDQQVEVLGTHFNINSYPEERSTKTTLVEGAVRVSDASGNRTVTLRPNQQAVYTPSSIKVIPADIELAIAWKNGDFVFNGDLETIMRQISRWYNVEIHYSGKIPEQEFFGSIPRSNNLKEVLKALQLTKRVHFKIEGRSVTVMP